MFAPDKSSTFMNSEVERVHWFIALNSSEKIIATTPFRLARKGGIKRGEIAETIGANTPVAARQA
jgi:hypothetical protein